MDFRQETRAWTVMPPDHDWTDVVIGYAGRYALESSCAGSADAAARRASRSKRDDAEPSSKQISQACLSYGVTSSVTQ